MSDNPYATPQQSDESQQISTVPAYRRHILSVGTILTVSVGFSLFIAPADPISEIITLAMVFGLAIVSYVRGVAVGRVLGSKRQ